MKLNIGENIRSCRRKMNLTQEQLADKLGVSFQSVSRWENDLTYPDMELIPALTGIFGVSADELLGVSEAKKEQAAEELLGELARLSDRGRVPEKNDRDNKGNTPRSSERVHDISSEIFGEYQSDTPFSRAAARNKADDGAGAGARRSRRV